MTTHPHAERLAVACPTCAAKQGERCNNYKGQYCHPHGARRPAAQAPPSPAPLTKSPTPPTKSPTPAQVPPSTDVIADAIQRARELVTKWGAAQAIRALQIALRTQQPQTIVDIADATRLRQMERAI